MADLMIRSAPRSESGAFVPLSHPSDFIALMKPRVMALVVFTTVVGMVLGLVLSSGGVHPVLMVIATLAIASGAGASGVLNQWYDRDIDGLMERTQGRPIPSGRVDPDEALAFGVIMSMLSVLVLWFSANVLAAGLLAFTIFFYGVVYSMWLKRLTPQNIVIGGAAGAFPPVIGWFSAGGGVSWEPLVLFGIIFMWTPPHFWALALVKSDDYRRAGVPMMSVVVGAERTIDLILFYSFILVLVAVLPWVLGMASLFYGVVSAVLGSIFLFYALRLRGDVAYGKMIHGSAMRLFRYSILYLFLLFLVLGLDVFIFGMLGGVDG